MSRGKIEGLWLPTRGINLTRSAGRAACPGQEGAHEVLKLPIPIGVSALLRGWQPPKKH